MEDHAFESAMEMIDGRDAEIEKLTAEIARLRAALESAKHRLKILSDGGEMLAADALDDIETALEQQGSVNRDPNWIDSPFSER